MCKSRVVERVHDAGGVLNTKGEQNEGEGGKMGYIYLSSCNFLVQLVLLVNEHKMAKNLSSESTGHHVNEEPQNEISYL